METVKAVTDGSGVGRPRPSTPSLIVRILPPVAVAAVAAVVAAFVWWADPTTPGGAIPTCPSKLLFGINCPGCGSARMAYSLLHLDLRAALHFNAVGVAAGILMVYGYIRWTWGRLRNISVVPWHARRYAPHIVLAVVLTWLIIRNIPVRPFSDLYV